ncbi:MAG TPA: CHAD domain-containing protein [Dehalococcoidia bacterium]|nr:CHAD domain-containing protein [Dehalococcoidia bacterium]
MEVEAKYSFRNPAAFTEWLGRDQLGPFALRRSRTVGVVDLYLDSADFGCLRGGYACRVRRHPGGTRVTLKSIADAGVATAVAVRRREELEVDLPAAGVGAGGDETALPDERLQPALWPESEARTLARRLVGSSPMRRLASISQERHERDVCDGPRVVAVLSLDRVRFDRGQPELFELEAELTREGSEADLAAIVDALHGHPDFEPQARSKLARALDGVAGVPPLRALSDATAQHAASRPADAHAAAIEATALRLLTALVPVAAEHAALADSLRWLVQLRAGRSAAGPRDDAPLRAALKLLRLADGPAGRRRRTLREAIDASAALHRLPIEAWRAGAKLAALAAAAEQAVTLERKGYRIDAISSTGRRTVLNVSAERLRKRERQGMAASGVLWRAAFARRLLLRATKRSRGVVGLSFDATLADSGRRVMTAQFAHLCSFEAELRDAAPAEAVHQARVGARRLRTTLHLFRRAYPRRDVRTADAGLRRLNAALGAVRDIDVMQRLMDDRTGDDCATDRGLTALRREWSSARRRGQAELAAQIDGPEFRAWRDWMAGFLVAATASERGAERLYARVPAMIWRRYGAARAAARDLPAASLSELHELRKEVRRLRYLLDGLRELLGGRSDELLSACVRVQDALGALHDADQLRQELERRRQRDPGEGGSRERTVRQLAQQLAEALPALRRAAEDEWPRVGGRAFRKRLGRAVASL